jgi:hypothetical protein
MTAKINSKIFHVNDSFSVNMYDNGFMVECSGRDTEQNYASSKTMCASLDELLALIQAIATMPRND